MSVDKAMGIHLGAAGGGGASDSLPVGGSPTKSMITSAIIEELQKSSTLSNGRGDYLSNDSGKRVMNITPFNSRSSRVSKILVKADKVFAEIIHGDDKKEIAEGYFQLDLTAFRHDEIKIGEDCDSLKFELPLRLIVRLEAPSKKPKGAVTDKAGSKKEESTETIKKVAAVANACIYMHLECINIKKPDELKEKLIQMSSERAPHTLEDSKYETYKAWEGILFDEAIAQEIFSGKRAAILKVEDGFEVAATSTLSGSPTSDRPPSRMASPVRMRSPYYPNYPMFFEPQSESEEDDDGIEAWGSASPTKSIRQKSRAQSYGEGIELLEDSISRIQTFWDTITPRHSTLTKLEINVLPESEPARDSRESTEEGKEKAIRFVDSTGKPFSFALRRK